MYRMSTFLALCLNYLYVLISCFLSCCCLIEPLEPEFTQEKHHSIPRLVRDREPATCYQIYNKTKREEIS